MELKKGQPRKPRVVIVGAGISGLAAARRLVSATTKSPAFELTVLEASQRVGGRIQTCKFSSTGEQVEVGATWIHGIEGNPIYQLAEEANALHGDVLFECMDGIPEPPIYKAEGGVTIDNAVALPVALLYKQVIAEINGLRGDANAFQKLEDSDAQSLGSFLQRRLKKYILQQPIPNINSAGWTSKLLLEGIFAIHENWERCVTAAPTLHDLNLPNFNEYWEFPGEQITIAKGFSAVVESIAKSLPPNTIQLSKKVHRIVWTVAEDSSNKSSTPCPVQVHCEDGSVLEADHVIVTVSLGILKARALTGAASDSDSDTSPSQEGGGSLFEPLLPAWKLEAIDKLGFGVVDKLFLLMEPLKDGCHHPNLQLIHRPDPVTGDAPRHPNWMRRTHAMYPIHKRSNILAAWFAGEEAKTMESLSDEEVARGLQTTLSSFGDKRMVAGLGTLQLVQLAKTSTC